MNNQANNEIVSKDLVPQDLATWLSYIESLHPKSIAMGLDRVKRMIARLQLNPTFPIIAVAGTNGKGSTCAMLEQIYKQAGYQVGCYSSPHLLRYNERVRVNGLEASDEALCTAFAAVEAARLKANCEVISLTYFEVGTLAAMWHFMQAKLDVVILEVGLGGRLDAVNAFEPSCAIVTSVDLDHQEFLGQTREEIGFEKAGVYRSSVPAICGDIHPPASLVRHAHTIKADFKNIHQDFGYGLTDGGWQYQVNGRAIRDLPHPALKGAYQLDNAACAVTVVESLQSNLPVTTEAIANAMRQVQLAGRFQSVNRQTVSPSAKVILDVAHNPHAALALAQNLKATRSPHSKTFAVFAMLADKDVTGVVEAVKQEIDAWFVASIDHVRGATATDLAQSIAKVAPEAKVKTFNSTDIAYLQACNEIEACIDANENDKIIVFGSFFTVSYVTKLLAVK